MLSQYDQLFIHIFIADIIHSHSAFIWRVSESRGPFHYAKNSWNFSRKLNGKVLFRFILSTWMFGIISVGGPLLTVRIFRPKFAVPFLAKWFIARAIRTVLIGKCLSIFMYSAGIRTAGKQPSGPGSSLTGDIMPCSWERNFTLSVPPSAWEYASGYWHRWTFCWGNPATDWPLIQAGRVEYS